MEEGLAVFRAEAPVIFEKQEEVGDRIFKRAKEMLREAWGSFVAVEFLVLTANFTTIREQTMDRLSKHGLLPDSMDGQKQVVFTYHKSKNNLASCVWKSNRSLSLLLSHDGTSYQVRGIPQACLV